MFKEITENAVAKAKEDIEIPQGIVLLIAVASFAVGLVVGILCASGAKKKSGKIKRSSFSAEDFIDDIDPDEDDEEGYEYSF